MVKLRDISTIAVSKSTHNFEVFSGLEGVSDTVANLKSENVEINVLGHNPGSLNILIDASPHFRDEKALSDCFGPQMGGVVYDSYDRMVMKNGRIENYPDTEIPTLDVAPLNVDRSLTPKQKENRNKCKKLFDHLLLEIQRGKITPGCVDDYFAFMHAAYCVLSKVYLPRFKYEHFEISSRLVTIHECNNNTKPSLFWSNRDDESHDYMTIIQMMVQVFSNAMTKYATSHLINEYHNDLDSPTSDILTKVVDELKDIDIEPATYATIVYLWLTGEDEIEDLDVFAVIFDECRSDGFVDNLLVRMLPPCEGASLTSEAIDTGLIYTRNDGYMVYTASMVEEDVNKMEYDRRYGLPLMEFRTTNSLVTLRVDYTTKTNKQMKVQLMINKFPKFELMNTDIFSSQYLMLGKNIVIDMIKMTGHMLTWQCPSANLDTQRKLSNLVSSSHPWITRLVANRARDDVHIRFASHMITDLDNLTKREHPKTIFVESLKMLDHFGKSERYELLVYLSAADF
uniref:Nonstructural protein P7 n=1 Tax=Rice gall dwarf virus TaxID=10986 RepID=Q06Y18_RGDV|nr:nonstructural protein P7 [Rice gall dwarf virus]